LLIQFTEQIYLIMDKKEYSIFETEVIVRPDDIDMNNHVHYSKYLDYLLFARFDQMERCYKMSMQEYIDMKLTWVSSNVNINYKRGLVLGEKCKVRTKIDSFSGAKVTVWFEILKESGKVAADGTADYTLISTENGRPTRITDEMILRHSI
jgi:YbgC/YbaW family acyl-CoA thioester hydrolase